MVTLFVNAIILLGITAMIGWSVFTFQRSSEMVSLAQRNAARMEQLASVMRGSLRQVNGIMRAPMGDEAEGRTVLPQAVVGDDKTPWGARYGYCPLSIEVGASAYPGAANATVKAGKDQAGAEVTYQVQVVGLPRQGEGADIPYVVGGPGRDIPVYENGALQPSPLRAHEQEIVGFILSPVPMAGTDTLPSCSDVIRNGGAWVVSGTDGSAPRFKGTVVPVVARGVGITAPQMDVALYAGPAAIGKGTGLSADDAMPLKKALDLWHLNPWRSATIHIAPGEYDFTGAETASGGAQPLLSFSSEAPGRSLWLVASGGVATFRGPGAGSLELAMGVDGRLSGIALANGIQFRVFDGARVAASGSQFGHVWVDGGELAFIDENTVNYAGGWSGSGMYLTSGRLRIAGTSFVLNGQTLASPNAGILVEGGELTVDGVTANFRLGAQVRAVQTTTPSRIALVSGGVIRAANGGAFRDYVAADLARRQQEAPAKNCSDTEAAAANGNCVASCPADYTAVSGSCSADPTGGGGSNPPVLVRSVRASEVPSFGGSANQWACSWRQGQSHSISTAGGSPALVTTSHPFPQLRVRAQCAPPEVTFASPATVPPA